MTTSNLELIIVLLAFVVLGTLLYLVLSKMGKLKDELKPGVDPVFMEWLREMKSSTDKTREELQRQLSDQRNSLDQQMRNQSDILNQNLKNQSQNMVSQTKLIAERLETASAVIGKVQGQLGSLQEFGKDMKDLSNVLKSPKMRGGLGEQFLYEILAGYLPAELYKTQYKFKDGDVCDAVIFTDKGMIPVDSKFPLENFKMMLTAETDEDRERYKKIFEGDVKKRIDEISKKYLLPEEGTTEQAVMYIPSENVFYELIVNSPQIEDYAKQRNVVMASPNTISYFLKIILVAYQQHELEKHTGDILKALAGIKIEADKFGEEMGVLERHISNSYKSMDTVKGRYLKIYTKLETVHSFEEDTKKEGLISERSAE